MPIRTCRPTSPGRRFAMYSDYSDITKTEPEKNLVERLTRKGGRNHHGHITCRHRGGGNLIKYRKVDFKRKKDGIPAKVEAIEYDPNRNVRIALLLYRDGERRYILCPKDLAVGDELFSGEKVEPRTGNCMPMRSIPTGMLLHNLELVRGRGGQLVRAAGNFAQLMAKEGDYVSVLLPSGEMRMIHADCRATIGQLGNIEDNSIWLGKAGRRRHVGWRPTVRGTAQNPVSHPMGGGEGRSGGGRHPCSPWGKLAKGGKTRKKRKPSSTFIVRGRKRGRFQNT
ncbi:MAG: 50S ribosomal protein L2 [Planctomycetes bacterium]|nr:50S ribosomal protein L2 [Planctomycetota bacterium]